MVDEATWAGRPGHASPYGTRIPDEVRADALTRRTGAVEGQAKLVLQRRAAPDLVPSRRAQHDPGGTFHLGPSAICQGESPLANEQPTDILRQPVASLPGFFFAWQREYNIERRRVAPSEGRYQRRWGLEIDGCRPEEHHQITRNRRRRPARRGALDRRRAPERDLQQRQL